MCIQYVTFVWYNVRKFSDLNHNPSVYYIIINNPDNINITRRTDKPDEVCCEH